MSDLNLPPRQPTGITPSQTVGPFFAYCLTPERYTLPPVFGADIATSDAAGERIRITGQVFDGNGDPVPDAMIEIWQADGMGRYAQDKRISNSSFGGFGRAETGTDGGFAFGTVKPGRVAGPNGAMQAPHINVSVFARGVLTRLHTRIYFADEAVANAADPILALVPADARGTLLAQPVAGVEKTWRFDIHLRGANETVFFAS